MFSIAMNACRFTHGAHMGREYTRLLDKVVPEGQWLQRIRALGEDPRCAFAMEAPPSGRTRQCMQPS